VSQYGAGSLPFRHWNAAREFHSATSRGLNPCAWINCSRHSADGAHQFVGSLFSSDQGKYWAMGTLFSSFLISGDVTSLPSSRNPSAVTCDSKNIISLHTLCTR
jgi:hypothetical protein